MSPGYCKRHTSNQYNTYLYLFGSGHPLRVGVEVDFGKTFEQAGLHWLSPTSGLLVSIATVYILFIWPHWLGPTSYDHGIS
jgi:hypothetical protein